MPLRSSTNTTGQEMLDIGSGIVLERQQSEDLNAFPIGTTGVEIYFQEIDRTAIFSVIKQPAHYRDGLFGITTKGKIIPITPQLHEKYPNMKVLDFTGFEGQMEPGVPETVNVKKGNKKKIYIALGGALVLGLTAMGLMMKKGNQNQEKTAANNPSLLQHHSLSHPIPGVILYDKIETVKGQSLEQLSSEFLISMNHLYELNPHLEGNIVDNVLNTDMTLLVPKAQEIFRLEEPMTWNDIGKKYGIEPAILVKINGTNVKMGDLIMIPTEKQAQDIAHNIFGEDVETMLYELPKASTLRQIALFMNIPEYLHELFFEMNLASENDTSPGAIHGVEQLLPPATIFAVPTPRDYSRQFIADFSQNHTTYDIHITTTENETPESIMHFYGITPEVFQKLNPEIPLNKKLATGSKVKTRDTSHLLSRVTTVVNLPKNVIEFVALQEMGTKKEGYLRNGITQTKEIKYEKEIKLKSGKKKTVECTKTVPCFPHDSITFEPGIDLGQIEEPILREAFQGVLAQEVIERLVALSKFAQAYKKEKKKDGTPLHKTALKEIPKGSPEKGGFDDLIGLKLSEKETNIVKQNVMQAYWNHFIKKHIPNIDVSNFATDEIRAAILSIIYHRGGYFFSVLYPKAWEAMKAGKWDDPEVIKAIEAGKKGTEGRTLEESEMFQEGVKKLGLLKQL